MERQGPKGAGNGPGKVPGGLALTWLAVSMKCVHRGSSQDALGGCPPPCHGEHSPAIAGVPPRPWGWIESLETESSVCPPDTLPCPRAPPSSVVVGSPACAGAVRDGGLQWHTVKLVPMVGTPVPGLRNPPNRFVHGAPSGCPPEVHTAPCSLSPPPSCSASQGPHRLCPLPCSPSRENHQPQAPSGCPMTSWVTSQGKEPSEGGPGCRGRPRRGARPGRWQPGNEPSCRPQGEVSWEPHPLGCSEPGWAQPWGIG